MEVRLPTRSILYPKNIAGLHPAWTFTCRGELTAAPLIVGGRLYIGSHDQHLYRWMQPQGVNSGAILPGVVF